MHSRDLSGILVVSVEQAVAAPYCSSRLAEAGARVLKIERPEGDFARGYDRLVHGESAYFVWLNRGKESVCLDLRQAADRDVLAAMIARAAAMPGSMYRKRRRSARCACARSKRARILTCSPSPARTASRCSTTP